MINQIADRWSAFRFIDGSVCIWTFCNLINHGTKIWIYFNSMEGVDSDSEI